MQHSIHLPLYESQMEHYHFQKLTLTGVLLWHLERLERRLLHGQ
jgi:hypothetical protein